MYPHLLPLLAFDIQSYTEADVSPFVAINIQSYAEAGMSKFVASPSLWQSVLYRGWCVNICCHY